MKRMMQSLLGAMFSLAATGAAAQGLEIQPVVDDVYALVGEMDQRSPNNFANNATFGVIVTPDGVVLVDPGGSYRGAEQVAATIATLTEQPVVAVINTGGQDHRWIGNSFFQQRGAVIYASEAAVADQKARARDQLMALDNLLGSEVLTGTEPVYAAKTFSDEMSLEIGGVAIELRHVGPAHTPGDSYVWLPEQQVVFTGDVVYVERMLGVGPMSNSRNWLTAFSAIEALQPAHVVPGHGHATDLATARADTGNYLQFLRNAVAAMLDDGLGMEEVGSIDQSAFSYLQVYEQIKGRNAQQVYAEMEFE